MSMTCFILRWYISADRIGVFFRGINVVEGLLWIRSSDMDFLVWRTFRTKRSLNVRGSFYCIFALVENPKILFNLCWIQKDIILWKFYFKGLWN